MVKRNNEGSITEKRMLDINEVCSYTGQGRTRARQYMDEIGATRKFGKRVLFDKKIIDAALDRM